MASNEEDSRNILDVFRKHIVMLLEEVKDDKIIPTLTEILYEIDEEITDAGYCSYLGYDDIAKYICNIYSDLAAARDEEEKEECLREECGMPDISYDNDSITNSAIYYSSVLESIGSGGGSSGRGGIGRISRRMKMFCRVSLLLLLLSAYATVVTGEVIDKVTTHEKVELSAIENGRLIGLGLGLCLVGCLVGYASYYCITHFIKARSRCQICQHCKTAQSEKYIMVKDLTMATIKAVVKEVKEVYGITLTELQVYSTLQCWNCCKLQFDGDGKVTVTNQLYEEDGVHEYQKDETITINKSAKKVPRGYHASLNFRDGTQQYLMEIMLPLLLEQKSKTYNAINQYRQNDTRYQCCNGENCPYDKKLNALKVPTSRYPVGYEFNVPTNIRCRGCINNDVQERVAKDGMEAIGGYFNPHYNESSKDPLFNQKILLVGGPNNTPIQSYIPDDMSSAEVKAALPIIDGYRNVLRERNTESMSRFRYYNDEDDEDDEDDNNMLPPITDVELKESDNKVKTLKKRIKGTNILLSINLSSCVLQNNGTDRPRVEPRELHLEFTTQQPGQDTDFYYKIYANEPEAKLRSRPRVFFVDVNGDIKVSLSFLSFTQNTSLKQVRPIAYRGHVANNW